MTKTVLLGVTFAAIFVASMIMAFAGGHLIFDEVEVEKKSLEIEVSADIPQDGSAGPFGYAAFGTKAILAITTHGGVGPDSESQTNADDPVFHTHALTAKNVAVCESASNPDGLAVDSASFEEVGDLEVDDEEIEVEDISRSKIGKLTGAVISFTLSIENGDICINVIDDATSDEDD